jgi:osmotically-inducible protein OsmY
MNGKLTLVLCCLLGLVACNRDQTGAGTSLTSAEAGPSASDRDKAGATSPTQPGERNMDNRITQDIRQSVMSDDSLSPEAKSVRIVVTEGIVTLRGTVKSQHEKDLIADKAKRAAGVTRVDNLLEVEKIEQAAPGAGHRDGGSVMGHKDGGR